MDVHAAVTANADPIILPPVFLGNSASNGWIQTFSGLAMHPARPREDEIDIRDIAHALANQCRYAGHCIKFYSVAEHCCLMSDCASPNSRLPALMHDASEAYLLDIPRPLKPMLPGYKEMEDNLMGLIAKKFDFEYPVPDEVKYLDTAIIADERAQNMRPMAVASEAWGTPFPPLGVTLQFWNPTEAAIEFLDRFQWLQVLQ